MGKKGPNKHLKRHQSPAFWPIERKTQAWATKTKPGPHSQSTSMPISVLIRDELNYAKTARESKYLVKQGKIIVDGKTRMDQRFPVGLMDVVTLPNSKENFRILPDHNGKLRLQPITEDEAKFKLVRVTGKRTLTGGRTQLSFHDGQNLTIARETDSYSVNDVIKLRIPEKEVLDHVEFKETMQSIITGVLMVQVFFHPGSGPKPMIMPLAP